MSATTGLEPDLPVLPGLRLTRELGRGGTGVVYRAERLADSATVAVKVLHEAYSTPQLRRRLREEATRAARVRHPGVVRVFEVGEQEGLTWLVMELVDGPSLQDVLDRDGRLPPALAAELIGQAADALGAIHAAGLAHGDLKPANLLLPGWPDADSTLDLSTSVKLVDFGLSRRLPEADLGLSEGTEWMHSGSTAIDRPPGGTIAYMAPEQWSGVPATTSSDIYAVGGTLYAALTGTRPFDEPSLPQLAYAVANAPRPVPSRMAAEIPPALDAVVGRALAKDPARRYPDAQALAAAVRTASRPASTASTRRARLLRRVGRVAGWVLSPAVLLLALLCFGSGFLTVSCSPSGDGRAAANPAITYTGGDLATARTPAAGEPLRADQVRPYRVGAQPLLALAGLLLLGGAVAAAVLPRRRRTR
ncbi:MAG: serine/threonine protein kinase, partial [Micromonosporaceae bacterium]|nr:serine/threonine protein kinase [Micromonosporaceae bacterium]